MSTETERAFDAARERDRRRFANDRDRCQDCGWVESCRCGIQWRGLADAEPAQSGR